MIPFVDVVIPVLYGLTVGMVIGSVVIVWKVGKQLGLRFFEPPDWRFLRKALENRAESFGEKSE